MKRREIIKYGLMGTAVSSVTISNPLYSCKSSTSTGKKNEKYDVIIVGGGPSGIGAAIMAGHLGL